MQVTERYEKWLSVELEDNDLINELTSIKGNESEILDRFYKELEFGTGGLRGVIGAGSNRMNIYTVRKVTQGIADYLNSKYTNPSVAIAFDSRNKSDLFAKEAACVFAANNIKVHIFKELAPTPVLSFAVRDLKCNGGVVITASHNPAKYNGYKVYGADGCQMNLEESEACITYINKVDIFEGVKTLKCEDAVSKNLISYIDEDLNDRYSACVLKQRMNPEATKDSDIKIVYTPLNGAGNKYVRRILKDIGLNDVSIVKEQEMPDGNFTTCPYPNPEFKEALKLGLELSQQVQADLLLATDPDSDRVGIAVLNNGQYKLITGNETGCLLIDYIAKSRIAKNNMPKNPLLIKTIVTSDLASKIAESYGIETINVLTGFKFIGEQIGLLEAKGEEDRYVLGFEESYGYLAGTYVRDKDAVVAAMLICEMAAFYKKEGKNLYEVLNELYKKHGYYIHAMGNFTCEGAEGMQRMNEIMETLRKDPPKAFGGINVVRRADYEASEDIAITNGGEQITEITLPKSNVLCYYLQGGASVIIRPSGTEPKIKLYYTALGSSLEEANKICEDMAKDATSLLGF